MLNTTNLCLAYALKAFSRTNLINATYDAIIAKRVPRIICRMDGAMHHPTPLRIECMHVRLSLSLPLCMCVRACVCDV